MKGMVIFIIMLFLFSSQLCFSTGNDNSFFTYVINKTPYIVIHNEKIRDQFQNNFTSNNTVMISLDSNHVIESTGFALHYHADSGMKCYPIVGDKSALEKIVGFIPGSKFLLQEPETYGNENQYTIIVEQLLYHSYRQYISLVILKCKPLNNALDRIPNFSNPVYPTHTYINWIEDIPTTPLKEIPEIIKQKTTELSKLFFNKHSKIFVEMSDEENERFKSITISPLRYFKVLEEIYYCSVISYGTKNYSCMLYLFNKKGEIIQSLKNIEFIKILGITDINRDGTSEIIIEYSAGDYNVGIQILNLLKNENTKKLEIVRSTKLLTQFD